MEKELFIERMLGVENLTDELEDEPADWLLKWGIARLDQVLKPAGEDPEAAGGRVNALMAVMRKINRMTGARQQADAESLAADFAALDGLFAAAFESGRSPSESECRAAAAHLAQLDPQPALEFLTGWGG